MAQLVEYDKKFIIIGNQNAITYKEIFPLIKDNKVWLGYGFNVSYVYKTPYPNLLESNKKFVIGKGYNPDEGYVKVPAVTWFTNLDHKLRHEDLILYAHYDSNEYPKYSNFDAIEVGKVDLIPVDYDGIMGVPITFLGKYNPNQFEIIGCPDYTGLYGSDYTGVQRIGEKWIAKYREQGGRGHYTANMTSLVYFDEQGRACNTFKRILIRKKANK